MNDQEYLLRELEQLESIPSPTGMTRAVTDHLLAELTRLGFSPERTPKGTVVCCLGGEGHPLVVSAHVDTLGLMVRAVKGNGCLRYTRIGGINESTLDSENVTVHTRDGRSYSATVHSTHASSHVWGDGNSITRSDETLEIVLDEDVHSADDVAKLGIAAGDYVTLDPKFVVTSSGYVKSRFLDDKASSAVLLTLARAISEGRVTPCRRVTIVFTVYEEIGHGAAAVAKLEPDDMLAVDMGCVGDDLACRETQVSICAKDSAGPYDYDFTNELIARAKKLNIDYAVDVYPHYASDTSAALGAGMDARFALCGQGVFASHGYERTHVKGLMGTYALVCDVAGCAL